MSRRDQQGATNRVGAHSRLPLVVAILTVVTLTGAGLGSAAPTGAATTPAVAQVQATEPAVVAQPGLLAFSRRLSTGRYHIFSVWPDGTHETLLTGEVGSGHDAEPSWSPNGRRLAYSRYENGHARIYTTDVLGQVETQLTAVPQLWEDTQPAWSPDGSKIAFVRRNAVGEFDLWVMNADGSGPTQLTTAHTDRAPAWSPDGTRIAFTRMQGGLEPTTDVWVMDADGTDQVSLTTMVWPAAAGQPSWSPDGSTVVFAAARDHGSGIEQYSREIAVSAPDGTGFAWLTDDPSVNDDSPAWSPDGAHIVFDRYTNRSTDSDLVIMDPDGSNQTVLADNPRGDSVYTGADRAVWSPDSLRIAFASNREIGPGAYSNRLYVVNVDGSGLTRITETAADGLSTDVQPSWQADATPPKVTVVSPVDGLRVDRGDRVIADYSCRDRESGLTRCTGTVPDGAAVDTSTVGPHTFTVTAKDVARNTTTVTVTYTVERRRPDAWIRAGSDPDVGDDVYNTTAVGQKAEATVMASPGARATFTVTFQNDGTGAERFRVLGQGTTAAFRVVYLAGGVDVTPQVVSGTYVTARLEPGATTTLTLRIIYKSGGPGTSIGRTVTAVSRSDPTKADAVRAKVEVL